MKFKTILTSILTLLLFTAAASAQNAASDNIKPQWIHKQPEPTNSTFRYEVVYATGSSLENARNKCLSELISSSGLTNGVVVSSDYKSNETLSQKWNNGKLTERVDYDANTSTTAKSKENEIFVENIDEYWTRDKAGTYYLTKLYAKSELGVPPLFDNVELTTKYGAHGLWRSAIVPGWGQFYKGSYLKGGLILGGTVALVGGIIFTENQRADYVNKISKTHSAEIKKSYATKRDHFATGRNICIGAAAALYVYNLIDAIVAPGARRVVVHKRKNGSGYAILPTMTAEGNPALAASITF
ncbi:MAG: hypothetical protein K2K00_02295 [Muribaculaceae bacterium]|nr:hypothetical protein [Muribaculaceae bacterium]